MDSVLSTLALLVVLVATFYSMCILVEHLEQKLRDSRRTWKRRAYMKRW